MLDALDNAGISGLVDIRGTHPFHVKVFGWQETFAGTEIDISGRGDGWFGEMFLAGAGGNLVLNGDTQLEQEPLPSDFIGRTGTLTVTMTGDAKHTLAVKVTGATISRGDKTQVGLWKISLTCRATALPAFSGFNDEVEKATTSTHADKELWAGSNKTIDPNGLQSGATRRFAVFGASDSDLSEATAITTAIAIASPIDNGKVRSATWTRAGSSIGYVDVVYGLTTTVEDIENAGTSKTVDQSGLETTAIGTKVNGTPSAPTEAPVDRKVTTQELNDGSIKTTIEFGLETVQAEREREAGSETADAQMLVQRARVGIINATQPATPDAPTGTVLYGIDKIKQEDGRYLWVFDFRTKNSKQEIEFDSVISVDCSTLDSKAELIVVQTTDAPDAAYTTPGTPPFTGAVYTDYRRKRITAATGQERYVYTYLYAYEKNAAKIERAATKEHLGDWSANAVTAKLDGTPDTHATLTTVVATEKVYYPGPDGGHVLNLKLHALETDPNKWIRTNSESTVDADGWDSRAKFATIGAKETSLGGLVELNVTTQKLIDGTTGYIVDAGVETDKTKWAREGTFYAIDPDGWESQGKTTKLGAEPTGGELNGLIKTMLTRRTTPDGTVSFEVTTGVEGSIHKWERTHSELTVDPDGWESRGSVAKVGSEPSPAGGLTKITLTTAEMPDGQIGYIVGTGVETPKVKWAREGTSTTVDPDGEESRGKVSKLGAEPTGVELNGLTKVSLTTYDTPDGTVAYVVETGVATSFQRLGRGLARLEVDPDGINSEATTATVNGVTYGGTGSLTAVGTETRLTAAGTSYTLNHYGTATSEQAIVRGIAGSNIDASGLETTATVAAIGGTSLGSGAGLTLVGTETRYAKDGTAITVQRYGVETNKARIAREATRKIIDPKGIESTQTTTGSLDTGLSEVGTETRTLADGSSLVLVHGEVLDTEAKRLVAAAEVAIRQQDYRREDQPTVITCAIADLATTAASVFAANQGTVAFEGVTLKPITTTKALQVLHFREDDKLATYTPASNSGVYERRRCRVVGGALKCWVEDVVPVDDTLVNVLIKPTVVLANRGQLVIKRRVAATTIATALATVTLNPGELNNATFLGKAARTLRYAGTSAMGSEYISGSHVYNLEIYFDYDQWGHYDDSQIPDDGIWRHGAYAVTAQTWELPATFGWTVAYHTAVDYSTAGIW